MIVLRESPQKKGRVQLQIDPVDAMLYAGRPWTLCSRAADGTILFCKKTGLPLHRAILNAKPGEAVQFINGDRLDFRRQNLRLLRRGEFNAGKRGQPVFRRVGKDGRPPSVCFYNRRQIRGGAVVYERVVRATFCFKRKRHAKDVSIDRHGLQEATRAVLAWRIKMLREYGMTPTDEMLDMFERVTRMARAGGGFEEIFGGNAEYENSRVVAREVAHWAQPFEEAA